MAEMLDALSPLIVAVAFVSGFIRGAALWSVARRLNHIAPATWSHLGSPDVRAFRITRNFSYEFAQQIARARLGWRAFMPGAFGISDKALLARVWVFRISTTVAIPSVILVLFLFLWSA